MKCEKALGSDLSWFCSYGIQTMAMLLRRARTVSRNFNLITSTFSLFIFPSQRGTPVRSLPYSCIISLSVETIAFRFKQILLIYPLKLSFLKSLAIGTHRITSCFPSLYMLVGVGTTDSALGDDGVLDIDTTISLETTWHDMEKLVSMGLVRSIGIRYYRLPIKN